MDLANHILDLFKTMTPVEAFGWLLVQNILQFLMCVGGGLLLIKFFNDRRIYSSPDALSKKEINWAICCVFLNTVVAVTGWFLWKEGIIVIKSEIGPSSIVDFLALLLMMDFLMYVCHRIVHIPGVYEWVHMTHHQYQITRPLSLFVLNPLEVFGFGFLWLFVLSIYQSSWIAIVFYLLLNASFGALGHIGVEPFPQNWIKLPLVGRLTTSTFHAQHHNQVESNFGFYTDVWDRIFGSMNKSYESVFIRAASGKTAEDTN